MAARTILNIEKPTTQTVESVKSLFAYVGRGCDPLPSEVSLENGRLVLVLSNKRDCYYVATARACSCPAAVYHHGPCKHQRKYFAEQQATTKPEAIESHKAFKPFIEDEARPVKAALPSPLVDTLAEPTARDVAYWSIKYDREMWPAEA